MKENKNLVGWSLSENQLGTNNPRDEGDYIITMFDFLATVGSFKSLVNSPYKKVDIADSVVFFGEIECKHYARLRNHSSYE